VQSVVVCSSAEMRNLSVARSRGSSGGASTIAVCQRRIRLRIGIVSMRSE